ncbi:MAG: hypothetical protein H7Y38_11865 [Armatimonadetes bacterium]|nr:hypothetical protein [Armatimonadota bacterium]
MPTETQTPSIVIEIPRETREAAKRIAGGVVAACVGASLAAWWVQNQAVPKVSPVAVMVPATVITAPKLANPSHQSLAEREERVRRDVFFSNFAEANTPDFVGAELPASEKARFAARHAAINVPERVQFQSGSVRRYVSGEWVAQTTERYFGESATTAPGDFFLADQDNAPVAPRFARVEGFRALPGGKIPRFAASVRVYEPPTSWKSDPFAWTMTTTNKPGEPKLVGTWNATVAKIPGGYNPAYRYVLLSWKRI